VQRRDSNALTFRLRGRLADTVTEIADREQNSAAAVARRLIVAGLERARQFEADLRTSEIVR
jgi:hypothetical protein